MSHVVGVDIGTQSTKALLVDARDGGRIVAQHAKAYQVETPRPLWAEQWSQAWLAAVIECVSERAAEGGVQPAGVKAIWVSGLYGGSGIPVDAEMRPLHPRLYPSLRASMHRLRAGVR